MSLANAAAASPLGPVFLRHDLMIELGRLEAIIEDARCSPATCKPGELSRIEAEFARLDEALRRLPS